MVNPISIQDKSKESYFTFDSLVDDNELLDRLEHENIKTFNEKLLCFNLSLLNSNNFIFFSLILLAVLSLILVISDGNNGSSIIISVTDDMIGFPSYTSIEWMQSSFKYDVSSLNYGSNNKTVSFLPWDMIIEPYKQQIIELTHIKVNNQLIDVFNTSSDVNYQWFIDNNTYYGNPIYIQLNKTSVLLCNVTVSSTSIDQENNKTIVNYFSNFTLASKRIRREIKSLNEDERNTYLDALRITYNLSTTEGRKIYGDKYLSAQDALYMHLNGAATSDCVSL